MIQWANIGMSHDEKKVTLKVWHFYRKVSILTNLFKNDFSNICVTG